MLLAVDSAALGAACQDDALESESRALVRLARKRGGFGRGCRRRPIWTLVWLADHMFDNSPSPYRHTDWASPSPCSAGQHTERQFSISSMPSIRLNVSWAICFW